MPVSPAKAALATLLRLRGLEPTGTSFRILAPALGILARGHPYGWHYLESVWKGHYPGGRPLRDAMLDLAAGKAAGRWHLVFGPVGLDIDGALLCGGGRYCVDCKVLFLPNHPGRKRCPVCSPPSWT